jgi:hypothetical protein
MSMNRTTILGYIGEDRLEIPTTKECRLSVIDPDNQANPYKCLMKNAEPGMMDYFPSGAPVYVVVERSYQMTLNKTGGSREEIYVIHQIVRDPFGSGKKAQAILGDRLRP